MISGPPLQQQSQHQVVPPPIEIKDSDEKDPIDRTESDEVVAIE